MPNLVIPNSFSANTTAQSAAVNANFNAVATLLNSTKLDATNIQSGSITNSLMAAASVGTTQIIDGCITSAKFASNAILPSGMIVPFGGSSAPTGWLVCDGSAVSRTTYSALFAVIGTAFGFGDNSSTFNVPDFRGRFLRGQDGAAGRDPDASSRTAMNSGGNTGDAIGSIQGDQFKSHSHGVTDPGHTHTVGSSLAGATGSGVTVFGGVGTTSTNGAFTGISINSTGGNETRPINANVNFIIKT